MFLRRFGATLLLFAHIAAVQAIGLGDYWIYSGLGQPLKAKVELIGLEETLIDDVRVKVASHERYEKLGLKRSPYLSGIQLDWMPGENNATYFLEVSNAASIDKPYLDLLLEMSWPTGQLVRQYTFLFNPPELVQVTPEKQSVSEQAYEVRMHSSTPLRVEMPYVIKEGESLWSIAKAMKGSQTTPLNIFVKALYDENPNAFWAKNVNALAIGEVLLMPSEQALSSITAFEAELWLDEQNRRWTELEYTEEPKSAADKANPQTNNVEWMEELVETGEQLAKEQAELSQLVSTSQEQVLKQPLNTEETHENKLSTKMMAIKEAIKAVKEEMSGVFSPEEMGQAIEQTTIQNAITPTSQSNEGRFNDLKNAIVENERTARETAEEQESSDKQAVPKAELSTESPDEPYRGPLTRGMDSAAVTVGGSGAESAASSGPSDYYQVEEQSVLAQLFEFSPFVFVGIVLIILFVVSIGFFNLQKYRRFIKLNHNVTHERLWEMEPHFTSGSAVAFVAKGRDHNLVPDQQTVVVSANSSISNKQMLSHEAAVRLELASAYIAIGAHARAQKILEEIIQYGSEKEQQQAKEMLRKTA